MSASRSYRNARARLLRMRLPSEYRAFLRTERLVQHPQHLPDTPIGPVSVRALYSPEDVLQALRALHGRLPIGWLPIAYDDCGNQLCISLRAGDRGSIHFWDHESELTPWRRRHPGTRALIARSFRALVAALRPLPSFDPGAARVINAWIDPEFLKAQSVGTTT